jgi:5-hydroxyisourate hydrolase
MSAVTTHVLDTGLGRPATGVPVTLLQVSPEGERVLGQAVTDADGRVPELGPDQLGPGTYQLVFDIATYAAVTDQPCFFPEVTLTFLVTDASHHHVPLLLSPFAYSTYRGS